MSAQPKWLRIGYMRRVNSMSELVSQLDPVRSRRTVGKMLGLHHNRIWQIERIALWKIVQRLRELHPEESNFS